MAQDITIAGASFQAVPSIIVPKTGSGSASFFDVTDTTATAADVAQGKLFFAADGTLTTGTASGGGGSSNIVSGTFVPNGNGSVDVVDIPYTGNGWPVMGWIFPKGGYGGSEVESTLQRYAENNYSFAKKYPDVAPTYGTSGTANQAITFSQWKNSTSSTTSINQGSSLSNVIFTSSAPTNSYNNVVRFQSATKMRIWVAASNYGFINGLPYEYHIIYSE